MTENAFPFDADADEVVAERNSRRLLALVAGLGALVLLAIFVVLPAVSGGDDEDEAPIAIRRPAVTSPAPVASPVPTGVPLIATFEDAVGRDPFRPLFSEPVGGGGGSVFGPGAGGAQPGTGAAPGTGSAPGGGGGPGTGSEPGTGGTGGSGAEQPSGGSAQVGGNRVALVDVFTRDGKTFAQTKVGSTVYTPAVGATFAGNYQLLTASGECATFLYGDENFQLCEGQEVLK